MPSKEIEKRAMTQMHSRENSKETPEYFEMESSKLTEEDLWGYKYGKAAVSKQLESMVPQDTRI